MIKSCLFIMTAALALAPVTGAVSDQTPQKSEVKRKAGTRVMDSLTFAQMYANKDTGKCGNFSWNTECIGDFTSSVMTIKFFYNSLRSLPITWTRPSSMAYPTSVRYGYTINAGQNQDSASKALDIQDTTKPYFPAGGDGEKEYAVEEGKLYSNEDKIVFWLGQSYMAEDLEVTGITFEIKIQTADCSITAGEGLSGAFVSDDQNAVAGTASATFAKGTKVYGFVVLKEGYKSMSTWTLVSGTADTTGAVYRVGTKTMGDSDISFGTINAATKTKTLQLDKNGGTGASSTLLTYGQARYLPTPTRQGYEFLGWNTKLDGTGTTYINLLDAQTVNAIVLGTLDISTLYAQWERLGTEITLSKEGGTGGDSTVFGIENDPMPEATMPTRAGYDFNGYFTEQNGQGTKYYNADGSSAKNWDKSDVSFTLYAYWTLKAAVVNAIDKIDAIEDPVVLTEECENHITQAREAYDNVLEADRVAVSNYDTLVAAEQRLAELKQAKQEATSVEQMIDALGTVSYPGSKGAIEAARAAYDALSDDAKSFVSNYDVLLAAEEAYENLRQEAIQNAVDALNAIPNPATYSQETLDALDAAKEAMNALTDEDFVALDRSRFYDAVSEYGHARSDAIDHVEELIQALVDMGDVQYNDEFRDAISEAREALDALLENDDEEVSNRQDLFDAEAAFEQKMREGAQGAADKIAAIGEVAYTPESKALIDEARAAYEALTEEQKAIVDNYKDLVHAEETYKHVDDVAKQIGAIGEIDLNSGDAIQAAQAAYASLTEEEKALIPAYRDILVVKANTYEKVVHDHKVKVTCAIVFGIIGGLLLLLCGAWALMLFVFNKWVKKNGKAVRACKLFGIKKGGKPVLLVFPLCFKTKEEAEIFSSKEEALK